MHAFPPSESPAAPQQVHQNLAISRMASGKDLGANSVREGSALREPVWSLAHVSDVEGGEGESFFD